MILSEASERALELPQLLALLAQLCATDLGMERASALRPTADRALLGRRRALADEARRLLEGANLVASRERPLRPILDALLRFGGDLDGRSLVEIGALLEITNQGIDRIKRSDPPCPTWHERVRELPRLDHVARQIRQIFDARGEIREDASPKLLELRGRIRGVRQRIYDQLSGQIENHRELLSEETIPMRGGRLVLVLQAGARGKVPGLVHGRSGSGRSFYFEPLDAVENNNQLQQAVEDEAAEKARLLFETIALLRAELPEIEKHAGLLADLDFSQAVCRFAERSDARLAELGNRHELRLVGARHPLLDPALAELREAALGKAGHKGAITPLELELDSSRRALLITGPNAGGKTVSLKTTGLLALMHQCGLPIPVAPGSRLPIFEAVVATVGDDQDLLADRSTFSGRLLRLREAWEEASPDALLVLDELGSGTDPEEGAALSIALLEGLLARRSLVLISTHLSPLAATALEAEGAFCAAMQFDPSTGRPTYRLIPGPPGGSEALALGYRLGLPHQWLERAEALLGSDHRLLRKMLEEVERQRLTLAAELEALEADRRDATTLRRRLEEREAELATERKSVGEKLRKQLESFRLETLQKLRAEAERLQRDFEAGRRKNLAADAIVRLFADAPTLIEAEAPPEEAELKIGGKARHRQFGWTGIIEQLAGGKAQVKVDGKTFLCKERDLIGVVAGTISPRPKTQGLTRADVLEADFPRELNLIGFRVEKALDDLDRYLDRALLSQLPAVRIIHGHGSGRLRQAVREHLRVHPAVKEAQACKAEEGGDGATQVLLDR